MKKVYFSIAAMFLVIAGNAQLFNQNFQSSTTLGSYSALNPTTGQFNEIYDGDAGNGMLVSINSVGGANTLRFVRASASPAVGGYTRSTDFAPQPGVITFSFTLNVSGSLPNNTLSAATWYLGNNFINGGIAPVTVGGSNQTYSYFSLDLDDDGTTDRARFRTSFGNTSSYFDVNTNQSIFYIANNSGVEITYNAPDGGTATLDNDAFDLWVGTSLQFDDVAATGATEAITDMKFLFNGGNGTIDMDNMVVAEYTEFGTSFYQNFTASTTVGDYDSFNPDNGQFNQVFDGGAGMALSINTTGGNKLRFTKSTDGAGFGGANVGSFTRTTNLGGEPNTLMFEFDFNATAGIDQNNAAKFYIGEGLADDESVPSTGTIHSYFEIDLNDAATDQFRLRKGGNTGSTAADVSAWFNVTATPQRILMVVNNSGASMNYYTPAGTEEAIANDTYVLWIGTTKAFTSAGAATSINADLEDFKFLWNDGTGTIDFDNMLMNPIPVANAGVAPQIVSNTINPRFIAKWTASNPTSYITGYRLDVATNATFTTFVSGFQNLYVDGVNSLEQLVTGVSTLNTHYIRVRPVYQVGANEVSGEFTTAISLSSAIFLPVELSSFTGAVVNKGGDLKWKTESEMNSSHYEIERSNDGVNFETVGNVTSRNSELGSAYTFRDASIAEGKNYYRLKMVDFDGKFNMSHVILLNYAGGARTMTAYPNPTVGKVTLQFSKAGTGATMKVISMEGRMMQQVSVPVNATQVNLNLGGFVPGIYNIVYTNNGEQSIQRIQKH